MKRRETLLGALAVAILALAFLWPGIAHVADSYYAPADIAQRYSLTRVDESFTPRNENLSDVWVQMHPWMMFNRAELWAGRLPLWNPWNGNGLPHLANFQSAVFSPLSLPYYALPFKLAILVAAFAKLFLFGFGMFLFLRELGLVFAAALFGACAVMFAGQSTIHLAWPQSSVACFLPWGLFVLERIAQRHEADSSVAGSSRWFARRHPGLLAAFVLVLAATVLAGHPETLYFVLAMLVAYAVGRAAIAGGGARLATLALELVACGVLAACACAIQLVPFFEYLRESRSVHHRSAGDQTALEIANWPLQAFPNLLGNPAQFYFLDFSLPAPDFTTATLGYVGILVVFLALVALCFVRTSARFAWIAAIAVAWFLYAHDVLGFASLLRWIPSVALAPMNRSHCIWQVALAASAAFALDRLIAQRFERRLRASALVVAAGALFFLAFHAGARALVDQVTLSRAWSDEQLARIDVGSSAHVTRIAIVFACGLALIAATCAVRSARVRNACALGLVLLAFAESGATFARYNPVTNDELFYPVTPAIAELQRFAGERDFAILGHDALPPASNAVYGLRQIAAYDALAIARFDELYVEWFGRGNNWRPIEHATLRALQFFGIECVLDRDGWIHVETAFGHIDPHQVHYGGAAPLDQGECVQEFTGIRDGLDALRVHFVRPAEIPDCTIEVMLEESETGRVIASRKIGARALSDRFAGRAPNASENALALIFRFEPIADSNSKRLRLRIQSPDATAENTLSPRIRTNGDEILHDALQRIQGRWLKAGEQHPDRAHWKLECGGAPFGGHLDFDLAYARSTFEAEREIGPFTFYRIARDACARFHTVGRARNARDDVEAHALVARLRIDPAREVLVSDSAPVAEQDADPKPEPRVRIESESPGRVRLSATRFRPGWLVCAQPWYPGWTARVNGSPAPFLRANYAFSAVSIPAGTSTIELDYEPWSVRLGAWITTAAAALIALAWFLLNRAHQLGPRAACADAEDRGACSAPR